MDGCSICMVGSNMERFVEEGIKHMEWDRRQRRFVRAFPQSHQTDSDVRAGEG